jgi:hypothetical protein
MDDQEKFRSAPFEFTVYTLIVAIGAGSLGGYFGTNPACHYLNSVKVCGGPLLSAHDNHGEPTSLSAMTTGSGFAMIDLNHVASAT